MNGRRLVRSILACGIILWTRSARATNIAVADLRDAVIQNTNGSITIHPEGQDQSANPTGTVGGYCCSWEDNYVVPFDLPTLPAGQTITSATLTFYYESKGNAASGGAPSFAVDLYGLNRTNTASSQVLSSTTDWYEGVNDSSNTLIAQSALTASTPVGSTLTFTGSALVGYLNQQYAKYAALGSTHTLTGSAAYVWFRFNPQSAPAGNYNLSSANSPYASRRPTLTVVASGPAPTAVAGVMGFTFSLNQAYNTSAGVYDSNGNLVRTLWGVVPYPAGTHYANWDGLEDNGTAAPPGNYTVKLLYNNVTYTWQGTVGNTSANAQGTNIFRSYVPATDLAFDPRGRLYFALGYNEGQPLASYADVSNVPSAQTRTTDVQPDYRADVQIVATDGQKVYYVWGNGSDVANTFGPTFIFATNAAVTASQPNNTYAGYPGTTCHDSNITSCADVDPDTTAPTGLAVQAAGNLLFDARGDQNVVRVFDKNSGEFLSSTTVNGAGRMAMNPAGDTLWVLHPPSGSSQKRLERFAVGPEGALTSQLVVSPSSSTDDWESLAVSTDGSFVAVLNVGLASRVEAYGASSGAQLWTYGQFGGNQYGGPGGTAVPDVANDRFAFGGNMGIATGLTFAADGSFWVNDMAGAAGNSRFLHIASDHQTYLEQIAWLPAVYTTGVDPNNPSRVFAYFLEYKVNYGAPLGGTDGSWAIVKNWAAGLPSEYFHFRDGLGNVVTLSNGRTYGLITDSSANVYVVELSSSGPLRFTGTTFTAYEYQGLRLHSDGSLRYTKNSNGTMYFYSQALTGFDAAGDPEWGGSPAANMSLGGTKLAQAPLTGGALNLVNTPSVEVTAGGIVVGHNPGCNTGAHLGGIPLNGANWSWLASTSTALLPGDSPNGSQGASYNVTSASQQAVSVAASWVPNQYAGAFLLMNSGHAAQSYFRIASNTSNSLTLANPGTDVRTLVQPGDNFTLYTMGNTSSTYAGGMPMDGRFDIGNSVNYCGNTDLAIGHSVIFGFEGENWKQNENDHLTHFYEDGLAVGTFGSFGGFSSYFANLPGADGINFDATIPGFAGNTFTLDAVVGSDGNTYLYHNDESNHGGVSRWLISGLNTIQEQDLSGALGVLISTSLFQPASPYFDMISTGSLRFDWTLGSNASGLNYIAQASTASNFSNAVVFTVYTSTFSASYGGLSADTSYFFLVQAASGPVLYVSTPAATLAVAPSPSTSAFTHVSTASVSVVWLSTSDQPDTLYECDLSSFSNFSVLASSSFVRSTSTVFTSILSGTTYYARVQAISRSGVPSGFASLGSTMTAVIFTPVSPAFPQISTGAITLSWMQGSNPPGLTYSAQTSTAANFSGTVLTRAATSFSEAFGALSADTSYFFRVQALNGPFLTVTTPTATLAVAPWAAPNSFPAVATAAISIVWLSTADQPDTLYECDLSSFSNFSVFVSSFVRATSASLSGLTPNTSYYARAQAISRSGVPSGYAQLGSTVTVVQAPSLTALPFSSQTSRGFAFTFSGSGDSAGTLYSVRVSTDPAFSVLSASSVTASTSAVFSNLLSNAFYYADAAAISRRGVLSAYSASAATATAVAAPGLLSNPVSTFTVSTFGFAWSSGTLAPGTSYIAQISASPTFATGVLSSATLNTQASFSGLAANTTYYAQVQAVSLFSPNPNGPFLSTAALTATLSNPPGFYSPAFSAITSTSVVVAWSPLPTSPQSSAAEGYRVDLSTAPDFSGLLFSTAVTPSASSAPISGLTSGLLYYARVAALNWESQPDFLFLSSIPTVSPPLSSGTVTDAGLVLNLFAASPIVSVSVNVPPGAFAPGTDVSVFDSLLNTGLSSLAGALTNEAAITPLAPQAGVCISASSLCLALGGPQPSAPVSITVAYDPASIPAGQNESRLQLFRYDAASSQWTLVPSQADPAAHTLAASAQHFSLFAPFFVAAASDLSSVQVFPQPWEIGDASSQYWASELSFSNLPAGASLKIFTLNGTLAWSGTASSAGVLDWDGSTRFGRKAASGTYYAVFQSGGQSKTRRVVIIR